ncbi:cation:proton antiporter [Streptomyces yunnanensis]|uniref:Cation:proton antiporter n=1 Tax=Streptomyces yunnanensis TaxID=156453 RepID=A0ABY8A4V4_9ACTN|nr:cation:proton antiporter [Streptomyces yunnanensis]WEB39999.1 cation:proton antiporter [Streptomyces yunnanensis]
MDALTLAQPVLVLGAIVPTALLGRWAARRLGQPEVVGEISVCLLLGVLLVTRFGWGGAHSPGKDVLAELGHLGLALFLVGAAHEIRGGASRLSGRAVAWLTVGSALLPMAAGALLAVWVLRYGGPRLRGGADTPALVLLLIVSLAVTAVPVLAGILKDRRMQHTETGRLAMASAVTIDAVTWVLLALSVALATGDGGVGRAGAVLAGGALGAYAVRRLAAAAPVRTAAAAHPTAVLVLVAAAAFGAATATGQLGLTEVFGAALMGLALPADGERGPFTRAADTLGRAGRVALPLLFTITGTSLAVGPDAVFSWPAVALGTGLAIAGKLIGSYLGARAGARSHREGLRLAALMNTRGLTEIVVLQTGYSAGILTSGLYLALIIMALVTTALSGPLLWVADRRTRPVPVGAEPTLLPAER